MFEKVLFKYIKDNFTITGLNISFGFGEVSVTTKAPYIIQYSLNANGDCQVLCNDNNFSDGEAFIQWNIYHSNFSNAFFIKHELMKFIGQLKTVECEGIKYDILYNIGESSPSGIDLTNGLAAEVVARSFTYNKK